MSNMFSGIVAGLGIVEHIKIKINLGILESDYLKEQMVLFQGASISLDGVCLTVVEFSEHTKSFDIIMKH